MSNPDQQATLDAAQALYREWLAAKSALQNTREQLEHALAVMEKLQQTYYSPAFNELYDADERGELNTTTQGEYSVMSQDTIYNEFIEKDQELWRLLKLCVQHLEN
ncbi:protein of unknown function [Moraxella cuniculi DSM 21768]|uniref:DUF4298 domain-containing protein n=1 Tax=Moraxella cuniculi DSM 21768 TaxID=1122245 RepID=A0A1N7DRM8_9GAMM|nr:DUF4298 domain-containing protein [Moraxella cuniculi]OOS06015.1 hypothetical protein B0189_06025 [Moraxella cuniculi]SIR78497.1 protein of unknown function [Moraxella cuniculi DSM 21768]